MDLIKELNKEALGKETPKVQIGDTVRVHVKVKEGSREYSGLRGHRHRQEARRHRGELHRPPHLLRHRRREGVPPPRPLCGKGRGGPPGQGAPRQAVLSAQPGGQGRQGQGTAVIQKRSGFAAPFS